MRKTHRNYQIWLFLKIYLDTNGQITRLFTHFNDHMHICDINVHSMILIPGNGLGGSSNYGLIHLTDRFDNGLFRDVICPKMFLERAIFGIYHASSSL